MQVGDVQEIAAEAVVVRAGVKEADVGGGIGGAVTVVGGVGRIDEVGDAKSIVVWIERLGVEVALGRAVS